MKEETSQPKPWMHLSVSIFICAVKLDILTWEPMTDSLQPDSSGHQRNCRFWHFYDMYCKTNILDLTCCIISCKYKIVILFLWDFNSMYVTNAVTERVCRADQRHCLINMHVVVLSSAKMFRLIPLTRQYGKYKGHKDGK